MKTYVLAVTVGVASLGIAHAQEAALEFPRQSIALPSLSLSGAAQQMLQSRLPDMTPKISTTRRKTISNMPIKKPDEGIDGKVLIATPDATKDLKLRVVAPEVQFRAK